MTGQNQHNWPDFFCKGTFVEVLGLSFDGLKKENGLGREKNGLGFDLTGLGLEKIGGIGLVT